MRLSRQTKTHSKLPVYRGRCEIIKQILQIVNAKKHRDIKSFELAYRCNLTWPQFQEYRALLLNGNYY